MVSQRPRRPRVPPPMPPLEAPAGTRARLIAAATEEFSTRGFDGAKVDRIAARARVNKAMLYYHFTNKAALYREILRDLFATVAARLASGIPADAPPEEQIRRFIRIIAAEMARRPSYPSIWLREMAESGQHLDASILQPIGAIIESLGAILREGERCGRFRPAHPVVVQMGIVAPLLLFAASAPTRARFASVLRGGAGVPDEAVVTHVEAATLAALRTPAEGEAPPDRPAAAGAARRSRAKTPTRRALR